MRLPWRRDPPPEAEDTMRRELRDADAVMSAAGIGDEPGEPPWHEPGDEENDSEK